MTTLVPVLVAALEDDYGPGLYLVWGRSEATSAATDVLIMGIQVPGRQFGPLTAARLGGLLEGE